MRVGEHFVLGFSGLSLPVWVTAFEREFGLGGVILFDRSVATQEPVRNVESPEQVHSLCAEVHALSSLPLVFVDQEGGAVRRLKPLRGFVDLPSQRTLAQLEDAELRSLFEASFAQMKALGIDFNLSPVVDLDTNPDNPNIGRLGRSFSADPQAVRRCVSALNDVAASVGLQRCAKHYPGVGGAIVDSHADVTDLSDSITATEIALFHELSDRLFGRAMLLSHGFVTQWDGTRPASISPAAVAHVRRAVPEVLLITDDVQMGGLRRYLELEDACLAAGAAGVDLICVGNNLLSEEPACFTAARRLQSAVGADEALATMSRAALSRIAERKAVAARLRRVTEP